MKPSPLSRRIRNGSFLMLLIVLGLAAVALPQVYRFGGAIRETLHRNYVSIEAAQHMHSALYAMELAQRDGTLSGRLAPNRESFNHWLDVELHNITEPGEAELAATIERQGRALFSKMASSALRAPPYQEFSALHDRLDQLIDINKAAVFRADSRANH
jgi:hypothetical protein